MGGPVPGRVHTGRRKLLRRMSCILACLRRNGQITSRTSPVLPPETSLESCSDTCCRCCMLCQTPTLLFCGKICFLLSFSPRKFCFHITRVLQGHWKLFSFSLHKQKRNKNFWQWDLWISWNKDCFSLGVTRLCVCGALFWVLYRRTGGS